MSGSVGMLNQAVSDMTNEVGFEYSIHLCQKLLTNGIFVNRFQSESDQERRGGLMKPTQKANGGGGTGSGGTRSSNSNLRRRGMQSSSGK